LLGVYKGKLGLEVIIRVVRVLEKGANGREVRRELGLRFLLQLPGKGEPST